jgi:hypothetical protein
MDRAVIPSYLIGEVTAPDNTSNFFLNYREDSLRIGVIEEIIPPTSEKSKTKRSYEYNVGVMYYRGTSNLSYLKYYNCVQMDTFGSSADRFNATFRVGPQDASQIPFLKGSKVLVLCVNSDTSQGVIVGGYPNENTEPPTEDLGHHLSFEFNGVQFNIDKDGQVAIKRRGPTNDDGTVVSGQETNGGATVLMTSDGSVSIQSGNGSEVKVDLDATNGSLNLTCTEGVVINSGGYSMVRGETIKDSVVTLVQGVINALNAIPAGGPGSAAVIPASNALAQFKADTSFLSTKNKVD